MKNNLKIWEMWEELPVNKEYKVYFTGTHEIGFGNGYTNYVTGKSFEEVVKKAYKLFKNPPKTASGYLPSMKQASQ